MGIKKKKIGHIKKAKSCPHVSRDTRLAVTVMAASQAPGKTIMLMLMELVYLLFMYSIHSQTNKKYNLIMGQYYRIVLLYYIKGSLNSIIAATSHSYTVGEMQKC